MSEKHDATEWIKAMLDMNRPALSVMPFPPGMREYVQSLVAEGNLEEIVNIMKMGFLMGLQQASREQEEIPMPAAKIQA